MLIFSLLTYVTIFKEQTCSYLSQPLTIYEVKKVKEIKVFVLKLFLLYIL